MDDTLARMDDTLARIDDTLGEQIEQKWNVWKRTETLDEALLCGEAEAAIQQWKNVSDKSVGKVFKAFEGVGTPRSSA